MSDRQPTLFPTSPDPWEVDALDERLVARVVFSDAMKDELDYAVPDSLRHRVQPGKRLRVPLGRGNRFRDAYCVELAPQRSGRALKAIAEVLDDQPLLSPELLALSRWMAEYYLVGWGKAIETVVPAGVRNAAGLRKRTVYWCDPEREPTASLPARQADVLALLQRCEGPQTMQQIVAAAGCSSAPVTGLVRKGLVFSGEQLVDSQPVPIREAEREPIVRLNDDQRWVMQQLTDALKEPASRTLLLHGITGSGKTEIYIRTIEQVVAQGRQAIVLVPEISLTPQTQRRFRARFDSVAVLHSHLTDAERAWHWRRIAAGQVQVIVGARSAVFAPTPALGLIVLDEEHDGSFKQDQLPRYHARDVARRRSQLEGAPLLLGSATPSLESWHLAKTGRATRLSLPARVLDLPLPDVVTIDLRTETRRGGAISRRLYQAMRQAITAGRQVILLLNRRGYATHIQCPACGHVVKCPECELALTHHRDRQRAVCHYCDYEVTAPASCPECRFEGIRYSGLGTQRLEAEVQKRFPGVSCLRMDSDTMRRRGSHERALDRFRAGEVQILLGTQMIAKGLDFPNVTVVGVINADTALHLPDFRASERTFQLVTQVAGRTGRGKHGGRVYVQTLNPEHPAIVAAQKHDYLAFAAAEMQVREKFAYPPFGSMARLVVRGPDAHAAEQWAEHLASTLRSADQREQLRVLGPAPAPIEKLRGNFRFHCLVQSRCGATLRTLLAQVIDGWNPPPTVQWIVDIDPTDML